MELEVYDCKEWVRMFSIVNDLTWYHKSRLKLTNDGIAVC